MTPNSSLRWPIATPSWLWRLGLFVACLLMGACSTKPAATEAVSKDVHWRAASQDVPAVWSHRPFPGKRFTDYRAVPVDGRLVIQTRSENAASMLRKSLHVAPTHLGAMSFSWKVPALIPGADLTQRDADDSPVRIVLAFDGERSKFSARNAMLSELAHAMTGEPMPYATLMYVWGNAQPVESVVLNPRTDRIRKLVVESGPGRLGRWLTYERDVRADFEKAFGEPPGALLGVGIMTDTDNTQQKAYAWYGPITLAASSASPVKPAVLLAPNVASQPSRLVIANEP